MLNIHVDRSAGTAGRVNNFPTIPQNLAPYEFPTWHTGAFVAGLSLLDAGAPVVAGRRAAGQVAALAVPARVLLRTLARVPAELVDARAAVLAGRRVALVHVLLAGLSREERRAGADVDGLDGGALAAVGTRVRGTGVGLLAQFT